MAVPHITLRTLVCCGTIEQLHELKTHYPTANCYHSPRDGCDCGSETSRMNFMRFLDDQQPQKVPQLASVICCSGFSPKNLCHLVYCDPKGPEDFFQLMGRGSRDSHVIPKGTLLTTGDPCAVG